MSDSESDSDDSDTEGGLGNVNKLVMRPPGHSGKAKKGHLCFDASFETGNLGRVDLISEFEYDLFIRPDTCSPRLRFWFNFTVDNVRTDQRVIFNVVNVSKSRNLFRDGMTPLVKSTSRPRWQRIPANQVYYYKSNQHQKHYVLSFAFAFDREEDSYQFALTYPYSYSRHLGYLDNLLVKYSWVKRELLATSVQKRKVELITITDEKGAQDKIKKVVAVLGRMHPGESPSSFVCQGLVDFLVSAHPIAQVLREYVVFKIVPMLNPDGVYVGNYRSTALGMDLNRSWNKISTWIHPSIAATKSLLQSLDKNPSSPLDYILDIHAHTNLTGLFIYGNTYDDVYRYERHTILPKLLAQQAEDYEIRNTMYNQDPRKAGTARRYLCSILNEHVNCYTVHVSMYGYVQKESDKILPYTEESYYRVGRNIARVFLEYYKLTGQIPVGLPNQPSSKRARQSRQRYRIPRKPRVRVSRTPAPLHLASIHEYVCDESLPEVQLRSMSVTQRNAESPSAIRSETKMRGQISERHRSRSPGTAVEPAKIVQEPPGRTQPRLAIIDFNQLTRSGLELATQQRPRLPQHFVPHNF